MSARPITLVLGTAAGAFLAAGLTSWATLPVAHADPAAVGNAVTADQFSDLLTGEGTPADNAVDNFYQAIANFFAPEAAGNADDTSPGVDTDFITATDPLLKMLGVTDVGAADPSDGYEAMVVTIPGTGITDVLTSGTDPSEALTAFGATATEALGTAGITVNTFTDTMNPALDPLLSFTIPFTDPLAPLWDFLVANMFFGL